MGCKVDDQDFLYEGPDWPPVVRGCGGFLAHVPRIRGSYSVFYQGLARFCVVEHNKSSKDVELEFVKILNLNERIDDKVYWCFFRLEAKDKNANTVDTYRAVVSYLGDKPSELRMFKAEEKIPEKNKTSDDEKMNIVEYIKSMEQQFKEELQKMKQNQRQLEAELALMRENHADLQAELAIMKLNMGMKSGEGAMSNPKSDEVTTKMLAGSFSSPPSKKSRCK